MEGANPRHAPWGRTASWGSDQPLGPQSQGSEAGEVRRLRHPRVSPTLSQPDLSRPPKSASWELLEVPRPHPQAYCIFSKHTKVRITRPRDGPQPRPVHPNEAWWAVCAHCRPAPARPTPRLFQQRPLLETPSIFWRVRLCLLWGTIPGVSEKLSGETSQGRLKGRGLIWSLWARTPPPQQARGAETAAPNPALPISSSLLRYFRVCVCVCVCVCV